MRGSSSRRRLRLRRKRKDETFGSKLSDPGDVVEARNLGRGGDPWRNEELATEVVGHVGCCVVEAVGSMAVLAALLTVPAHLLIR